MAKFTAAKFPFVVQMILKILRKEISSYLDGCTIHRRSVEGRQDRFLVDDGYWQILTTRCHDFLVVSSRIGI